MIIVAAEGKGWTFYLSYPKSNLKIPHFTEVLRKINSWLEIRDVVQTFNNVSEEEIRPEIKEIRTVLEKKIPRKRSELSG